MKLFAMCMQCQQDLGHPSFEPFLVEYFDDGYALIECSAGHKTAHLVQSPKFEILLESGATAILEGFTLEACASFSAALERFYEFGLRVMMASRGIAQQFYQQVFKEMARHSERQLGAFIVLYALEFGEAYKTDKSVIEFRNAVIHKGEIPTREEAMAFMADVYRIIVTNYRKLVSKYPDEIVKITFEDLAERQSKVPAGIRAATNTATMFFNAAKNPTEVNVAPDFTKALDAFRTAARMMSEATPYMKLLHEALRSRQSQPHDNGGRSA